MGRSGCCPQPSAIPHWSEFIGGDFVISPSYKWQLRYNASDVEVFQWACDEAGEKDIIIENYCDQKPLSDQNSELNALIKEDLKTLKAVLGGHRRAVEHTHGEGIRATSTSRIGFKRMLGSKENDLLWVAKNRSRVLKEYRRHSDSSRVVMRWAASAGSSLCTMLLVFSSCISFFFLRTRTYSTSRSRPAANFEAATSTG